MEEGEEKRKKKEKEVMYLCFGCEIWKQIWLKCRIYSYYKRVDIDINLLWKSFKFNLFSPVGAYYSLQPYLSKALKQGFLMPQECSKEAERSILLFSRIYEIMKYSSASAFLGTGAHKDFSFSDFSKEEKQGNKRLREFFLEQCIGAFEISYFSFIFLDLKNIEGNDKHAKLDNLCALMDAWDINIDLIDFSSSFSDFDSLKEKELHDLIYHMFLPFL